MFLYHKLFGELELADAVERPRDARDEARGAPRRGVPPHVTLLRTELLQPPLDPDEPAHVLIARPRQANPLEGERDLPPGLRSGVIGTIEVRDQLDEPEIVRRDREPHPASVPDALSQEWHGTSAKGSLVLQDHKALSGAYTRTRASSSTEVRPAATFERPSSQRVRMPASIAARSTSSRLALATASCAIVSVIVSS